MKKEPNFIMLSQYDDGTFNVDFFDKLKDAEGWRDFELGKAERNPDYRMLQITIYAPVKEVKE